MPDENGPKPGDIGRASEGQDVVIVHGVTQDGGLEVLRLRNQHVEVGALQKLEHGKPIHGEVVSLRPRPACPLICDVEVELPGPRRDRAQDDAPSDDSSQVGARRGPAQVASERYRTGWELIFGSSSKLRTVN